MSCLSDNHAHLRCDQRLCSFPETLCSKVYQQRQCYAFAQDRTRLLARSSGREPVPKSIPYVNFLPTPQGLHFRPLKLHNVVPGCTKSTTTLCTIMSVTASPEHHRDSRGRIISSKRTVKQSSDLVPPATLISQCLCLLGTCP